MTGVMSVQTVATSPIEGQKPGTSGLRKKTKQFMEPHYLENFVQSTFNALVESNVTVKGGILVVSGDGRFHNAVAVQTIIKMAFANGVSTVWVGQDGLLSTPAMSAVIRERCNSSGYPADAGKPFGGFILTASHNPGGIDQDFGIKYNCENGGPAPDRLTNKITEHTKKIDKYLLAEVPHIDVSAVATHDLPEGRKVEVICATKEHLDLLRTVFDFEKIKALIARKDFSMCYDAMNGVNGPYAKRLFVDEFGVSPDSLINCVPKEDFGGKESPSHGHADPNLTYAVELIARMGLDKLGKKIHDNAPQFGAASDGDADRNMILGKSWFVSPSDSLAIIAAQAKCIPWFKDGLKSVSRSMPTSGAVDLVAKKLGINCFEVPTGWKYFGNLMDSGVEGTEFAGKESYTPLLCGEESFGTGSDHAREKDSLFAILCWLQILAERNMDTNKPLVTVEQICKEHWNEYGRNYYARYDYEGVDKPAAETMMENMKNGCEGFKGQSFGNFVVKDMDMFQYSDPVDGAVAKNQGIRIFCEDGSRIVFRLSGTGVAGATIRLYLEKYDDKDVEGYVFDRVKPLAEAALALSKLSELTGRTEPSVIT